MADYEQTRDSFMEALVEIMQRFYDQIRKKENEPEEKGEVKELSENAKKLLETLKKDPELTRNLIQQYAIEKIDQSTDKVKEINDKILMQLSDMKGNIDTSTPEGKEKYEKIDMLEKIQLEKEASIKDKIYKLLIMASEKDDNESESAMKLAEKLMKKYEINKEDVLSHGTDSLSKQSEKMSTMFIDTDQKESVISNNKDNNLNSKESPGSNNAIELESYRQESVYVEKANSELGESVNWNLDTKTVKQTETQSNDKNQTDKEQKSVKPTSVKLKEMEEKGINISRLHSKISVDKEYDKMIENERNNNDEITTNEKTKEKNNTKVEVEIER